MNQDYLAVNKELWNQKTPIHLKSDFYEVEAFRKGKTSLKPIELALLGDIKGKSILHLQCHFGQDSMCLSRMGADVTGVDISDVAIHEATKLSTELGLNTTFVCCDVYAAKELITEKFDIVFTTYGTIGWLPDMDKWADIVSHFLKPTGKFVFVELHPVVWIFDAQFEQIMFSYFNKEAIIETTPGTYANQEADIQLEEIGWNHSLHEVFTALLNTGLSIKHFSEYDYSPHNCFKNMKERAPGEFVLGHLNEKLPMCYSLVMEF